MHRCTGCYFRAVWDRILEYVLIYTETYRRLESRIGLGWSSCSREWGLEFWAPNFGPRSGEILEHITTILRKFLKNGKKEVGFCIAWKEVPEYFLLLWRKHRLVFYAAAYLSRHATFLLKMIGDRKRLRDLEKSSNYGSLWIIIRLRETAHLPLPKVNFNTYFSLRTKCWFMRREGGQFPRNFK